MKATESVFSKKRTDVVSVLARLCAVLAVLLFLLILVASILPKFAFHMGKQMQAISNTRQLSLVLYHYANDHQNQYPDGASSTQIFQKLIDEGYLTPMVAADLLHIEGMPGKTRYAPQTTWEWMWDLPPSAPPPLKPENVCYDLIAPLDDRDHDLTPLIISTGWEIPEFAAGAEPRILNQAQTEALGGPGMVIHRVGNSAFYTWIGSDNPKHNYPSLKLFPPEFTPFPGKAYHQLRP